MPRSSSALLLLIAPLLLSSSDSSSSSLHLLLLLLSSSNYSFQKLILTVITITGTIVFVILSCVSSVLSYFNHHC